MVSIYTLNVIVFQFLALLVFPHVLLSIQLYIMSSGQPYIGWSSPWLNIHGQTFLSLMAIQFQNPLGSIGKVYLMLINSIL